MSNLFSRAPHIEGSTSPPHPTQAPNAALLVDFDNVTMGMRSDLSKELKTLLGSDVIRGKVTVQRAYADWRRYPQYIVPLSEASIDLIFAPAYGSSKKNATDIRMAIDGIELVFTRPEIGTYILLTGDSDFSSLVLKLKEYGKYVIGVGIQESSSDILVQNCDEYYSYTSLSGLRKTDEEGATTGDPWVLVERAAEQMTKRGDVMRSDRLKQVMLEIDSGFDEKSFGFNKFSRFLAEAAKKGLIQTQKMENGQYEILPARGGGKADSRRSTSGRGDGREPTKSEARRGGGRDSSRAEPSRPKPSEPARTKATEPAEPSSPQDRGALEPAYDLLRKAILDLLDDQDADSVRDSDVKRRMLALQSDFDEATLGFPKFSRFLRQAHDHEIVDLKKGEGGNYHVALGAVSPADSNGDAAPGPSGATEPTEAPASEAKPEAGKPAAPTKGPRDTAADRGVSERPSATAGRLRPRSTSRSRGAKDEPPPLFEGQVVKRSGAETAEEKPTSKTAAKDAAPGHSDDTGVMDPAALNLPTGRDSVVQYLSNSYGGVGKKTAEALVDALGEELFVVLQQDPSRVEGLLPRARAEKVLEGWTADYERRLERHAAGAGNEGGTADAGGEQDDGQGSSAEQARRRRGRRTRSGGGSR